MKKKDNLHMSKKTTTILQRFLSLTPKTIVIIVSLVLSTGASAIYIQSSHKPAPKITTSAPTDTKLIPVVSTFQKKAQEPPATSSATAPTPAPTQSHSSPTTVSYQASVCNNIPIPYKTDYMNDNSLAVGERKIVYSGKDGYFTSCTADSTGYIPTYSGMRIDPVNALVYQGTGLDAQRAATALTARNQQYDLNLANCIQNLRVQGVPSSSAQSACSSYVKY